MASYIMEYTDTIILPKITKNGEICLRKLTAHIMLQLLLLFEDIESRIGPIKTDLSVSAFVLSISFSRYEVSLYSL
jgi:ubiquitin-protein ligase